MSARDELTELLRDAEQRRLDLIELGLVVVKAADVHELLRQSTIQPAAYRRLRAVIDRRVTDSDQADRP